MLINGPQMRPCKLRIEMNMTVWPDYNSVPRRADNAYLSVYNTFSVGAEADFFRLTIADYDR